tara:strand:- start:2806 stop:3222 length:417 start_codon:yes stop_codon:yes gene_type:complete
MANEFVIKNGLISNGDSQVNGDFSVKGSVSSTKGSILGGYIRNLDAVTVSTTSADTSNVSVLKVNGTGVAESFNLADGISGQRLTIYGVGTFGRTTVNAVTGAGWSSFELSAVGNSLDLIYDTSVGWVILGNRGGTIS